ncbi:unnamed protein product [Agarophyton chilense]
MDSEELRKVDKAVEPIHLSVRDFMDSIAEEFIVYPVEKMKEKKARVAVQNFRNACADALEEITKWEDKERVSLVRNAIKIVRKENESDIALYETALVKFYDRKKQYDKSNVLTRNILSPRSRSREKLWDEEAVASYPEMNCMMLCFILFGLLFVGWVLSHVGVGGIEDINRQYVSHRKAPFSNGNCVFSSCNFSSMVKSAVSVEDFDKMEL